jgi:hypothetical protein
MDKAQSEVFMTDPVSPVVTTKNLLDYSPETPQTPSRYRKHSTETPTPGCNTSQFVRRTHTNNAFMYNAAAKPEDSKTVNWQHTSETSRRSGGSYPLKKFNNEVKRLMIKMSRVWAQRKPTDMVRGLDLCGGRNSDMRKWRSAGFGRVHVVDISEQSLVEGKRRYAVESGDNHTPYSPRRSTLELPNPIVITTFQQYDLSQDTTKNSPVATRSTHAGKGTNNTESTAVEPTSKRRAAAQPLCDNPTEQLSCTKRHKKEKREKTKKRKKKKKMSAQQKTTTDMSAVVTDNLSVVPTYTETNNSEGGKKAVVDQTTPGRDWTRVAAQSPILGSTVKEAYDVVSVMFALHYFASTEEALTVFLHTVYANLRPGGVFIGVAVDGDRIAHLLKHSSAPTNETTRDTPEHCGATAEYKNTCLVVRGPHILKPGDAYQFALRDSVVAGTSTEFSLHEDTLVRCAKSVGLQAHTLWETSCPGEWSHLVENSADGTKVYKHLSPAHMDSDLRTTVQLYAAFCFTKPKQSEVSQF